MISKQTLSEFADIVKSIKIISSTKFSYLDSEYQLSSDNGPGSIESNQNNYSGMRIRDILYNTYHCRINNSTKRTMPNIYSLTSQYNDIEDFTGALSEANTSKGTWEPSWEVIKFEDDGRIVVNKNGLNLWASPKQFYTPDGSAKIGKKGYLRTAREFRRLIPGFYMANGNSTLFEDNNVTTVRFYWNVQSPYASLLVKHITTELNKASIPFCFKVLNNPHNYPRADAGVLYVHKKYVEPLGMPLLRIYKEVKNGLNDSTPLLAKKLGTGLSLAEDPSNGESFGQHRCRILEEALYKIRELNSDSIEESIMRIRRYFQNMDLNLDYPYLNPHSVDDYDTMFHNIIFD